MAQNGLYKPREPFLHGQPPACIARSHVSAKPEKPFVSNLVLYFVLL